MNIFPKPLRKGQAIKVTYDFFCNLHPDSYSVSIGVAQGGIGTGSFKEYLLLNHNTEIIKVIKNDDSIQYSGFTNLRPNVKIEECP